MYRKVSLSCVLERIQVLSLRGLMSWITWVAVLVAWPIVGLGVAYLFGRFVHEAEEVRSIGDLVPPKVSYLRRLKRAKTLSRATTQTRARRVAGGGRRH